MWAPPSLTAWLQVPCAFHLSSGRKNRGPQRALVTVTQSHSKVMAEPVLAGLFASMPSSPSSWSAVSPTARPRQRAQLPISVSLDQLSKHSFSLVS